MKKFLIPLCLVSILGIFYLGTLYGKKTVANQNIVMQGVRQTGFEYVSPLLECEYNNPMDNVLLNNIKNKVSILKDEVEGNKDVDHLSVYFRDLNNGPWFGINERDNFSPASLLKVPIMLAIFKEAEKNPEVFDKELEVSGQGENSEVEKKTVEELIKKMIINSDNIAFNTLLENINYDKILRVHQDLGLPTPEENSPEDFITVKQYASIFRILYNASYLNTESSQEALRILTQVSFVQGLRAGVPEQVKVAHKYGFRNNGPGKEKQLHDCGIVYFPNLPYLVCVMTKGENEEELNKVIKEVSAIIYEEVANYNN